MSPEDELLLIVIKELLHSIGPELHNVSCPIGVSDEVRLDPQLLVVVSGVTPQYVYHQLLFWCGDLMDDFQRPLDHLDLVQTDQSASNSSMEAHNLLFNDSTEREPIKQVIDFVEN